MVEGSEREQKILEHALADKSAQLQLQTTKTEAAEEDLAGAKAMIALLQERLQSKCAACTRAGRSVAAMAALFSGFKSTFNQALTRLVNYEHRIMFAIKRMQSLKGMPFSSTSSKSFRSEGFCSNEIKEPVLALSCFTCAATFGYRSALMLSRRSAGRADVECQVEQGDSEHALSSLTKQQLELDVQTLSQERDHLIGQLEESTEAFQLQLKSLEDKCEWREANFCDQKLNATVVFWKKFCMQPLIHFMLRFIRGQGA